MRISGTGPDLRPTAWRTGVSRAEAGFTLVEILIVVFIVALMSAVVVVNLPAARPAAVVEADALVRDLNRASREAIVSGEPIALSIRGGQYRFERYRAGFWSPTGGVAGSVGERRGLVTLDVVRAGDPRTSRPEPTGDAPETFRREVVFSPVGDATPAEIIISGQANRIRIDVSASAEIQRIGDDGAPL